jgi:hypothetical protein
MGSFTTPSVFVLDQTVCLAISRRKLKKAAISVNGDAGKLSMEV